MQKGGQMRFSDDELALIKATFKDNEKLLKLLRKIFLPEYDPNAPLGQGIDLWMTVNIKEQKPEEALRNLQARNELIMHVDQQLIQLDILAKQSEETPAERIARNAKNSAR